MRSHHGKTLIFAVVTILLMTSCATSPDNGDIQRPYKPVYMPDGSAKLSAQCQRIVPYTKPLDFPSKYQQDDDSKSRIDRQQQAEYEERTRHINTFALTMVRQVEKLARQPRDTQSANCYIHQLSWWANANALLSENVTKTGIAVRKWTLASLAASYLRLSISPTQDTQKIESWLSNLANQVISEHDLRPARLRNNHDYWAYWAVMNVSAITQNTQQYQWALNKWVDALDDIDANGFLRNEMQRGPRAREYHNFAAMPLIGSATFIAINSPKTFERHSDSLLRLVKRLANNISHNRDFSAEQPPFYDMFSDGRLAWVPMFLSISHFRKESIWTDLEHLIEQQPPAAYSRLGGNTLKYFNY